jgi:hypothetical protein
MQYYVIGDDGQKYGPADVATLSSWATQNRVTAATQLEEVGTGRVVSASQVPGLTLGPTPVSNPSYTNPPAGGVYQQPMYAQPAPNSSSLTVSYVLAVLGLCCCFLFPIGGIFMANKAKQEGNPGAQTAMIVNVVCLVLGIIGFVSWLAMRAAVGTLPSR